jgi:hypothetical protein
MMNLKPQIKESSECMRMIREFAGTLSDGNQVDKDVSAVLCKRMSHVTSAGKEDSPMSGRKRSNSMYNGMKSIRFDIIEDTARDIAEQFTLVSFESFKRIPMDVLIKKRFEKQTDATETPLGRFVNFFNDVCQALLKITNCSALTKISEFSEFTLDLHTNCHGRVRRASSANCKVHNDHARVVEFEQLQRRHDLLFSIE